MRALLSTIIFLSLQPLAYTADWYQIGLDIYGEAAGDGSGWSVSLSADGAMMAVGAPGNSSNGSNSGHARIYQNESGVWAQVGSDIGGESAGDRSGNSVSLSADGSVVAIGAPFNDGNGEDSGHVRVYRNLSGEWTQVGSDIDGKSAGDRSGNSVSLSSDGSVVAIGAPDRLQGGLGTGPGYTRVYRNLSGVWTQVGSDIDGEASGDASGFSVSLSADGSVVAIGAVAPAVTLFGSSVTDSDSGYTRVYHNLDGEWTQVGSDIDGEALDDWSGHSVSLSADGSMVAIGAPWNDGNEGYSGHVRVYRNLSGEWTQVGSDIDGETEGDFSGYSVSLSADGSVVVIGAPSLWLQLPGKEPESGYTRVYRNLDGEWTQVGSDIDGEATGDASGFSVSLSADSRVVAIGAPSEAPSGRVRSFISSDSATEPPIIRMPLWSQSSGFSATLRGQPESYYRIQWSKNLIDWIDFASFVSESIETPFEDPEIEETDTRFYRAVSP